MSTVQVRGMVEKQRGVHTVSPGLSDALLPLLGTEVTVTVEQEQEPLHCFNCGDPLRMTNRQRANIALPKCNKPDCRKAANRERVKAHRAKFSDGSSRPVLRVP